MHGDKDKTGAKNLTILLPGGALSGEILVKVAELTAKYGFEVYLSTAQNLRLYNIDERDLAAIRAELGSIGARFKGPGLFPIPRICIGRRSCNLGLIDTMTFSEQILRRFGGMTGVKPKFKIAVSGCPAACSNPVMTDIGIIATRQGFDIYLGGKGGPNPKAARRIMRQADGEKVLEVIAEVVEYHNTHGAAKQRLGKLLDDPDFPYREEV